MIAPFPPQARLRRASLWFIFCAALFLASALILRADTPAATRSISAGGCYCNCSHSKMKLSCTKMCETPRYASRWGATTCAKPRVSSPVNKHGAGPRFPRRDRAERASR